MIELLLQSKHEFWLKHVVASRSSGLLQTAYSHQHNPHATTFNNWVRRDRQETSAAFARQIPHLFAFQISQYLTKKLATEKMRLV